MLKWAKEALKCCREYEGLYSTCPHWQSPGHLKSGKTDDDVFQWVWEEAHRKNNKSILPFDHDDSDLLCFRAWLWLGIYAHKKHNTILNNFFTRDEPNSGGKSRAQLRQDAYDASGSGKKKSKSDSASVISFGSGTDKLFEAQQKKHDSSSAFSIIQLELAMVKEIYSVSNDQSQFVSDVQALLAEVKELKHHHMESLRNANGAKLTAASRVEARNQTVDAAAGTSATTSSLNGVSHNQTIGGNNSSSEDGGSESGSNASSDDEHDERFVRSIRGAQNNNVIIIASLPLQLQLQRYPLQLHLQR